MLSTLIYFLIYCQQLDMLRKELRFKSDELVLTQENCKKLASEKQLLEEKVICLNKDKNDEVGKIRLLVCNIYNKIICASAFWMDYHPQYL